MNIDFTLQIEVAPNVPSAARLWLDTSRDDLLQSPDEEITLFTADGKKWIGRRNVDGDTSNMMFFVKFLAPIGSKWSFKAESIQGSLYELKDQITAVEKESLVGRLK